VAVAQLKTSTPGRTAIAWGRAKGGAYAAGLAFRAFTTMFPLMLGILSIVGLVIRDAATEAKIQDAIIGIFPPDAHSQLVQALQSVKHSAGILGLVSLVGLVWGGTGLFASMEFALTAIFGTRQRDILRQRLIGLLMMVIFILAILLAVSANNAAAFLPFMPVTGFVIGAVVMIALLTLIYRFVPNRSFTLKEVLPGAVLAGILIEVLTLIFPLYAKFAHGFNTYGQQFALFFLLATWLYFLSQFLLMGAVFNRVRLGRPGEAGVASAPEQDARDAPSPSEAIDEVKNNQSSGPGNRGRSVKEAEPASAKQPAAGRGQRAQLQRPLPVPAVGAKASPVDSALYQASLGALFIGGLVGSLFKRRRRGLG
jgi:membrane protein